MTLQLHRPDGSGGLVPTPPPGHSRAEDWRKDLRSYRWHVAPLRNTEMNPTSTVAAVAFWVVLAGLTFALLLWGYGSSFWHWH
jgi:hypothetical protein